MISLAAVIIFSSFGQYFLKVSTKTERTLLQLLSIALFSSAAIASILSVSELGLYVTYLSAALSILLTAVLSKLFLKEIIGLRKLLGLAMIVIGVIGFAIFS